MAVTAQSVLKHVSVDVLQDSSNVHWDINQLVRYLNRVQQMVGIWRPDLFIEKRAHALSAGVRQTLPSGYLRALDFLCNTSGRAVSVPPNGRALMDAQKPTWRSDTQSDTIYHVFYDPREPLAYEVWPPATSLASLDVKLQKAITAISEPGTPNKTYTDVTGNLSIVDDPMWTAIADGVCYLAFAKDAAHASQAGRAVAYAQAMAQVLGIEPQQAMQLGAKTDNDSPVPATAG
jgi:hypothetical protein